MMRRGCGRPVRTLRTFCDDRAAPVAPVWYFLCAKEMRPIMWPAFGAPLLIRIALSALDASCTTAHGTIKHDASGLRPARAHVAHLFARSGGSYRTCFVLFVCEIGRASCRERV